MVTKIRRMVRVAGAFSVAMGVGLALASPAAASAYPVAKCGDIQGYGACMVLYYNSGMKGSSVSYAGGQVNDFAGDKFLTSGAGKGTAVKNNAASAKFLSTQGDWGIIYYNSNGEGPCDSFAANHSTSKLKNTYNENASYYPSSWKPSGCYAF
ncbi:hypothetical protein OHR86_12165 [Streptomyces sp. NBC_00441]|uniref:hypothetical protein n=1 Tax=Streptomyces sp. NBC_00441 TaxID=2975742 RepID=UPI002E2E522D|nr:hypothetical protein [Streptomyces sp. NBC_00441]